MNKLTLFLISTITLFSSLPLSAQNYTKDEVAHHSVRTDCWIIVDGSVYDISRTMKDHDRYKYQLDSWCGKEATKAWRSKDDRNKPHSRKAQNMLKSLRVGGLKD